MKSLSTIVMLHTLVKKNVSTFYSVVVVEWG